MKNPRFAPLSRGFTLIELIAVLVILGILTTLAVVSLNDDGALDSRALLDQTQTALRYAQKTAMTQQRYVCVAFPNANQLTLSFNLNYSAGPVYACDTALLDPANSSTPYAVNSSKAAYSATTNFAFDPNGKPVDASGNPTCSTACQIAIAGEPAPLCIAAQTGRIYMGSPSC